MHLVTFSLSTTAYSLFSSLYHHIMSHFLRLYDKSLNPFAARFFSVRRKPIAGGEVAVTIAYEKLVYLEGNIGFSIANNLWRE
jgi:hypothetical protein